MVNPLSRRKRTGTRASGAASDEGLATPEGGDVATAAPRAARVRATPAERFDTFYGLTWQPLLVQTFAVSGDLALAREATQAAFVDAWHHWSRAEWRGPETYVRAKAFGRSQWRGRTRTFHRGQRGDADEQATLKALQTLTPQARKAVVLACLSEVALPDIGRQIGETDDATLDLVDAAMTSLGGALQISTEAVPPRLHALTGTARAAAQPTAREVRHLGVRRRRLWLGGGVAAAVALTLGAGALVYATPGDTAEKLPPSLGPEVTAGLLLPTTGLEPLGKPANWTIQSTGNNTQGTGLNTFCQSSRFADPHGLRAFVRTYQLDGVYQRQATQTIELSRTEQRSRQAYAKVLSWFGGCRTSQLQLLTSYDVQGLGDQAEVIKMRAQGANLSSYAVGVVRTGHILTWTAFVTQGARNPDTDTLVDALGNALQRVCTSKAAGACTAKPVVKENPPPPSGEQAGMLATADLPPVPTVTAKWVGTAAQKSRDNPAATTCDGTDMAAGGADPTYNRTFLIPNAGLPPRFGLSETLGQFPGVTRSRGLVADVVSKMDKCEKRDPGAHVTVTAAQPKGVRGSSWYFWRLESEISDKKTIVYWMGVARVGANVAQVSFVPGDDKQDLSKDEFQALIIRARDRLFELPATTAVGVPSGTPSDTPSGTPSTSPSTGSDAS